MKESLREIPLQVYEDQKVVSIAQRVVITDSVGRCHHYHPRVENPLPKYFLNDAHRDDEMTVTDRAAKDRHIRIPYLKGCDAYDGDDDEMQGSSRGGAWEESFEAVPTIAASLMGKREKPWRPAPNAHTSRDVWLTIAYGWSVGLLSTSPIIVVVALISAKGPNPWA